MHRGEEDHSEYLWCLHCYRAYRWGEYRLINGLQMCPYDGCNGDTFIDGWTWESVRESNPKYPKIPKLGHVYELNRTPGDLDGELREFQRASKYAGGLLPQAQAARILGLSKQRVNALIAEGRLMEHDFFGKNFISCADIWAFKRIERPPGRPKKRPSSDSHPRISLSHVPVFDADA
ncbi:MAG: hypothetical protein ACREIF_11005 [Chthoniobacterales bacterium]